MCVCVKSQDTQYVNISIYIYVCVYVCVCVHIVILTLADLKQTTKQTHETSITYGQAVREVCGCILFRTFCLSVFLSLCLSFCLFGSLYVCMRVCMYVCMYYMHTSFQEGLLYVCMHVWMYVYARMYIVYFVRIIWICVQVARI